MPNGTYTCECISLPFSCFPVAESNFVTSDVNPTCPGNVFPSLLPLQSDSLAIQYQNLANVAVGFAVCLDPAEMELSLLSMSTVTIELC